MGFVCLNDMNFIPYDTTDSSQAYKTTGEDTSFFETHYFLYDFNDLFHRINGFHNTTFFQE